MDVSLLVGLLILVAAAALLAGRSRIAKGANAAAANGVLLMALGTLTGVLAALVVADLT
ncbi:hypothetical protein [Nocardioides pantholopis]|uniref:hypothetical protein n=1 Tax=Nocardioides pantholopis TaxID=2483798 RepID=UPI0013E3E5F0|nr:hypothetical protein [Nocardioides pantholopis]